MIVNTPKKYSFFFPKKYEINGKKIEDIKKNKITKNQLKIHKLLSKQNCSNTTNRTRTDT